ncbi:MAG: DUF3095 family protein [Bacteroidota bacterium]
MDKINDHFYNGLSSNNKPIAELLLDRDLFAAVPQHWHVIITDIKGSTLAVSNGMHQTVNMIATGSITIVLNLAYKNNITIPFFFGGDGATFILPDSLLNDVLEALGTYKQNTQTNFNLDLRVGHVTVDKIYQEGYALAISKALITPLFSIPILIGNGLAFAEELVKGTDYLYQQQQQHEVEPDLTGMQCRWDKISPPENAQEIVTLLVLATVSENQRTTFSKVLSLLDEIYGPSAERQPISVKKLRFNTTFDRLSMEMKARVGKLKFVEYIKKWLINLYGYIYFRTESGKYYLNRLVEMSDTLVIDGRINTVISGTLAQRTSLIKELDTLEASEEIIYGIYVSGESVMSCYVRDLVDEHIHFVDGSEGGYTKAAGVLKEKIRKKLSTLH